eukprot:TRINITY_DN2138_c0_g1_i1.p1 TRINITY_DN2138_c0_g1~~TRINITY_DN2138_c0_g1_i1.p1  ORF type:complete len:155 (-),score=35.97 TRINITY_DN2138_c0_g1_i1:492-956(-)
MHTLMNTAFRLRWSHEHIASSSRAQGRDYNYSSAANDCSPKLLSLSLVDFTPSCIIAQPSPHVASLRAAPCNVQCMADVILDRVQADPEAAKPLPHQRWCAAADWALPSVEATVDDALQDSIGGLQEALKSCAEASREADRLLRQMGDPAGEAP